MRALVDAARIHAFMRAIGQRARTGGRVFLAGGACAVLLDWRPSTLDISASAFRDAVERSVALLRKRSS
jgi:hypothetical protein